MKKLVKFVIALSFLMVPVCSRAQPEKQYTVEQLRNDFRFLQQNLVGNHPNLYLYTSKNIMDQVFDSLAASIAAPMTELDFYKHITVISPVIGDGHTIILPSEQSLSYHNKSSKFLPYKLRVLQNRLFVELVQTSDTSIGSGAEILSINTVSAAEIINTLMDRQVRDGNNLTYPNWILNNYFKGYFSFHFGHPEQFEIRYKQGESILDTVIKGLFNDSINYYRKRNYPGLSLEKRHNEGILLTVAGDSSYAIITIKDFHNDVLKKEYRQNFKTVIDAYFRQIEEKRVRSLVLDIRNNQGGDIENGAYLLRYLLSKPFVVLDAYYNVDNTQNPLVVKKLNGPSTGFHQPHPFVFTGKLLVLINGGSFSNSGIVAACLKRNDRAQFIGEETGGNNMVLAGDAENFHLPNTGITIEIPTKRYLLEDRLPFSGRGTMPDHDIPYTLADILHGTDPVLQYALEYIRKTPQ
jgi:hypothetical protein